MPKFGFPKKEHLKSRKAIHMLFSSGSQATQYPIKIFYQSTQDETTSLNKCAFAVPKRNFRKAVDRNKVRRRMREAYRLNRHRLSQSESLHIVFLYVARDIVAYPQIEYAFERLLEYLAGKRD
jgi:ribonuclease P protein component